MSSNVIEITARFQRDAKIAQPDRVITRHKASEIMFGGVFIEADYSGRVLSANIQYGEVYIYIEERAEPPAKVRLHFKGFRAFGDRVPPGAQYLCSVYEHGDHAHIYLVAASLIES